MSLKEKFPQINVSLPTLRRIKIVILPNDHQHWHSEFQKAQAEVEVATDHNILNSHVKHLCQAQFTLHQNTELEKTAQLQIFKQIL